MKWWKWEIKWWRIRCWKSWNVCTSKIISMEYPLCDKPCPLQGYTGLVRAYKKARKRRVYDGT